MRHLKLFESFNKLPFTELDSEEVENYLLEKIDKGDIIVRDFEDFPSKKGTFVSTPTRIFTDYGRIFNLYSDKFNKEIVDKYDIVKMPSVSFIAEVPHPPGVRGTNLDLDGYTRDILNHYLKRIHDSYDVNIYIQIQNTMYHNDIISRSRIIITPKSYKVEESNKEMTEYIESFFAELSDHKDDTYPIVVNVYPRVIGKNKYDGYQIRVDFDLYDKHFIEKKIETIKSRLKPDFSIRSSSISKSGEYRSKDIPVHGTDRTTRVLDPIYRWSLTISPKFEDIKESAQNGSTLIIVDVQKSFKKWFNENYVNELMKYAAQFSDVYQIWDNHHQGKSVDKDYLYDEDPEIPVDKDLYTFPNQRKLIEKRYNYDVDVEFYKKVLDKETYQKIKNTKLKKGDYFPTTEGTGIVYIGNNHQWFHIPIKLHKVLKSLVGKQVTIVGGSDSECLEDIVTACESLGVAVKRDWKYIYSANHCPIK